jgi:Uma2 family endonuclease
MGIPKIDTGPMTVEEFFSLTDHRPDNEKWELIDGEPILHASPSRSHQRILLNLLLVLGNLERQQSRSWELIPGLGVRVSATSLPEPDALVRPKGPTKGDPEGRECDDMIVAFEIISPSTAYRDLRWKRTAYTNLPSLTHYVMIAQDAVDVVVFARDDGFAEQRYRSLDDALKLPSLGVWLPLSEIYRDTGLA